MQVTSKPRQKLGRMNVNKICFFTFEAHHSLLVQDIFQCLVTHKGEHCPSIFIQLNKRQLESTEGHKETNIKYQI